MDCSNCKHGHVARSADPCERCNDFDQWADRRRTVTLDLATAGASALGDRVSGLLDYNNRQVEKRRAACALLREAAGVFRQYEQHHRAKFSEAGRPEKAERNAEIAGRIEQFLSEIHS